MKAIYKPKGAAGEYAELALNIYTGCTNGCAYCYAPGVMRKTREEFAKDVTVREGLLEALERQLAGGGYEGKTIHLCFTCDPYPIRVDHTPTREAIRMLKDAGCRIQLLTKNPDFSFKDWCLLDEGDCIGTTISGDDSQEGGASFTSTRLSYLRLAKEHGFGTWVSCEPVLDPEFIKKLVMRHGYIDLFKFGKLNHRKSDIDWASFGIEISQLCEQYGREYMLKDSLLKEMGNQQ